MQFVVRRGGRHRWAGNERRVRFCTARASSRQTSRKAPSVNFGSLIDQPVAPADVATILGSSIRPGALSTAQLGPDGNLTTLLGGYQVFFSSVGQRRAGDQAESADEDQHDDRIEQAGRLKVNVQMGNRPGKDEKRGARCQ